MSFDDSFNVNVPNMSEGAPNVMFGFDNDVDPAAEFLEREKRELGDITGDTDTDLFTNPFNAQPNNTNLSNGTYSPNLNIDGTYSPVPQRNSPYHALSDLSEQINEPEKIRRWREEFAERISKKDSEEEIKRNEMLEQAKKELDDFYRQRNEQLERTKGQNRMNNRPVEDDLINNRNSSATVNGKVSDWDKITSLCDFNPKNNRSQKDLTRYRSVLLQLKQQQANNK